MAIQALPNNHLHLSCDGEKCSGFLTRHGASEEELLLIAVSEGWRVDAELDLHFCPAPWHTIHECEVCGAVATNCLTPTVEHRGQFLPAEDRWFCDEHWDPGA